jgi:DNA-binding CsgD family transcriptional regulator/PAS domain-containing protein
MAREMGTLYPIVLPPRCPADEDPEVQGFLRLAMAMSNADWVELELQPSGPTPPRGYRLGTGKGKGSSVALDVGGDFDATLRLGTDAEPAAGLVGLMAQSLAAALRCRRMLIQTELLRGALDTISSSIFIFDASGDILFASPSADRLLSLQTEDELLVGCNDHPKQPLYTMLSTLVDTMAATDRPPETWKGVLEFDDGRVMACEVGRLPEPASDVPAAVLVLLHPVGSEATARVQAFASSHGLSRRERDVLELLEQGLTTGAMADALGISPHTVRDHLKHLYRKTATKGRGELLGLIARVSRSGAES